jgi:hypothetical protein
MNEQEIGTPAAAIPSMYQLFPFDEPCALAGSKRIGSPFTLKPVSEKITTIAMLAITREAKI